MIDEGLFKGIGYVRLRNEPVNTRELARPGKADQHVSIDVRPLAERGSGLKIHNRAIFGDNILSLPTLYRLPVHAPVTQSMKRVYQ